MAHHLALTSAAVLMAGGCAAFYRARSVPSLVGSAALASAFLTSSYMFTQTDHQAGAAFIATAAGVATAAIGRQRYLVAMKKAVPMMIMAVGAANAVYYGYKTWEWKENL